MKINSKLHSSVEDDDDVFLTFRFFFIHTARAIGTSQNYNSVCPLNIESKDTTCPFYIFFSFSLCGMAISLKKNSSSSKNMRSCIFILDNFPYH